jgi:DNA-binding transcriptional LysR family regulator
MLHSRLLKYVDEVARCGSIRKAANRLNVASSAINRQILSLEQEMGAPIFERLPRGLRLTTAGELLISHIRQTLKEHDRVRTRIESLKGLRRGEVTIATMTGPAGGFLARTIADFAEAHPGIKVKVTTLARDGISTAVVNGEADLGLAYNLPNNPRLAVFFKASYQLQIGAIMAPGHPLARRVSVRLADCLDYPLVVADATMSIRDVLEAGTPTDLALSPSIETNSIELMKRLATKPPNISFLNAVDVGEEIDTGTLVLVPVRELQGQPQVLSLVHRSKGALESAAHLLASDIRSLLEARDRH